MVIASVTLHALIAVGLVWGPTWIPRPKLQTYEVQLVSLPAAPNPVPIREVPPVAPQPRPPKPVAEPPPVVKPAVKPVKTRAERAVPPTPKRGTHAAEAAADIKPPAEPTPEPQKPTPTPEPPEQVASIPPEADRGIALVTPLMEAVALKYPYYTNALLRKMDANWSPPGAGLAATQEVLVTFTILRDGSVRGTNIEQSSGNLYYDQAALRTVLRSSPFPPLPPGYAGDTMTVHFSFLLDPERGP
ncbi:MAG: energy transducer TonB [Nitrospiria bacterium]